MALLRKRSATHPYPRAFCVYEKKPVGPITVVPRSRMQTGCDERPVAFDRDHINLVKPSSADDEVYAYVAARINRIVAREYTPLKISARLISVEGTALPEDVALKSGDQYALQVELTRPAWAYVFAKDSRGRVERYFCIPILHTDEPHSEFGEPGAVDGEPRATNAEPRSTILPDPSRSYPR